MNEEETKIPLEAIAENIDQFERSIIDTDKNANNRITTNEVPATNWDETPVSGPPNVPPGEAFVVPLDVTDANNGRPSTNRQANTYAAKKTVAQGMMDIALITANANQLRYIIEYTSESKTYHLNLVLICLSLLLQVAVGMALIFKGRCDLRGESKFAKARRTNNLVVVGVFLVTIINVFIASFTITGNDNAQPTKQTVSA